jgi:hypothetical protein
MTASAQRGWRGAGGAKELSDRDLAILFDLARVRLLTGRHVQRLHFHDGSPLTQARRSRSTLQRLSDRGWVIRLERRVGGVHAGSAGFTYGLSAKGQRLTAERGPAGGRRTRRPWEPSLAFGDHLLAGSEIYVRLRELEATGKIEELEFQSEPDCWRYWSSVSGERLVLKPDAFIRFGEGDFEHAAFIEVDQATQSRTVIWRKGQTYSDYYHDGAEQRRLHYFPKVIFVTTSQERRGQIAEALARLDAEDWHLFQVQTMAETFTDDGEPPPTEKSVKEAI